VVSSTPSVRCDLEVVAVVGISGAEGGVVCGAKLGGAYFVRSSMNGALVHARTNHAAATESDPNNMMDPIVVFDESENNFRYPRTKNTPRNTGSCASVLLDWNSVSAVPINTSKLIVQCIANVSFERTNEVK